MKFLLDTNICIYALKRRPANVLEKLRETDPADVALSVITLLELRHGAEKSQQSEKTHAKLDLFLAPIEILALDEEDAEESARIRAKLQIAGTSIGDYDCLIAGQARARNLILVSNNLGEFSQIDGLRMENWAMP